MGRLRREVFQRAVTHRIRIGVAERLAETLLKAISARALRFLGELEEVFLRGEVFGAQPAQRVRRVRVSAPGAG